MSTSKQASVTKRLLTSGALPIARDTPSYASVMSVCHGGAAGQLEYVTQRGSFDLSATGGLAADAEEKAFLNSRAEAKKAHLERLHHLRGREREPEVARAEGKTAFQIAVSVANASEAKVSEYCCLQIKYLPAQTFSLLSGCEGHRRHGQ